MHCFTGARSAGPFFPTHLIHLMEMWENARENKRKKRAVRLGTPLGPLHTKDQRETKIESSSSRQ